MGIITIKRSTTPINHVLFLREVRHGSKQCSLKFLDKHKSLVRGLAYKKLHKPEKHAKEFEKILHKAFNWYHNYAFQSFENCEYFHLTEDLQYRAQRLLFVIENK